MALTKITGEGVGDLDTLTVDGDVTLNDGSPNLRLKDTDTNRFVDLLYGTRVATIRNTMAAGEDIDSVEPSIVFSFKDDGETRTAVNIDHDGIVTKPLQPAFQAVPASSQDNIATGTDVTIIFGTERFDIGSNFASNTFTAPVTGKYYLNAQLRVQQIDTGANYYQLKISTSNHNYVMTLDPNFSADLLYGPMSISIVADMDASDTATVKIHQSGGSQQTDINTESYFSGYLLG